LWERQSDREIREREARLLAEFQAELDAKHEAQRQADDVQFAADRARQRAELEPVMRRLERIGKR
jgi:hypothetical protein